MSLSQQTSQIPWVGGVVVGCMYSVIGQSLSQDRQMALKCFWTNSLKYATSRSSLASSKVRRVSMSSQMQWME